MRDYGKVFASFWTSETTRSMSEDARNLALYLITCPHNTISGVFRLPDGYVCDDMQWGAERVGQGFAELLEKGFANRCETTKWVVIYKHFEWNPPENPNQRKSAAKIVLDIPSKCSWRAVFIRGCAGFLDIEIEPLINPSETLSKPVTVTVTVTGTEAGTEAVLFPSGKPTAPVNPSLDETALQTACRETWDAYSDAYAARYGTKPVRNAKINGQIKNFVQRLGFDESPHVAAFFVCHASAYYVKKCHDTGSLLADAEKLRMEWQTGRMVTNTSAQQSDRTQSNFNAANEAIRMLEAEASA